MIRKSERPCNFTDRQIAQLKQIHSRLRTLNRNAICELRRISRTVLNQTQYREAGESFGTLAIRMISLLRVHQEILSAGHKQEPQLIQVLPVTCCNKCSENGAVRTKDEEETGEAASREVLNQDPACQQEIEALLELVFRIDESVSRTYRRAPPRAFFLGLKNLTGGVLRQQRQFRETAITQGPRIEVLEMFDTCDSCGAAIKNDENQINTDKDLRSEGLNYDQKEIVP
jgi:hypothetical protein